MAVSEARRVRRKRLFLKLFAELGTVTGAAGQAGVRPETVRAWRESDPEFARQYEEAAQLAADRLEEEARRRAVEGVLRKRFTRTGRPVIDPDTGKQYVEAEYSDSLLMFLLKARNPARFRDRVQLQHADADGGKLPVEAIQRFLLGEGEPAEGG